MKLTVLVAFSWKGVFYWNLDITQEKLLQHTEKTSEYQFSKLSPHCFFWVFANLRPQALHSVFGPVSLQSVFFLLLRFLLHSYHLDLFESRKTTPDSCHNLDRTELQSLKVSVFASTAAAAAAKSLLNPTAVSVVSMALLAQRTPVVQQVLRMVGQERVGQGLEVATLPPNSMAMRTTVVLMSM
jgi:hypothetical protein